MLLVAFCMLHRQQALLQECDFPSAVACIERSLEICDDLPVCNMHHAPCSIRHPTCTRPSCVSTPVAFAIATDGARNHRCSTSYYVATCRTMLQHSVLCCNIVLRCTTGRSIGRGRGCPARPPMVSFGDASPLWLPVCIALDCTGCPCGACRRALQTKQHGVAPRASDRSSQTRRAQRDECSRVECFRARARRVRQEPHRPMRILTAVVKRWGACIEAHLLYGDILTQASPVPG